MSNLPSSYKLEKNLSWDDFEVNECFDDSYDRLNIDVIEYISDIFITYHPGGENLTVDQDRKRRVVLKVNRTGNQAYPFLQPGDGYLFTIYNEDLGTTQLGTKPVRLVTANQNYLVFRGHDVLAVGPLGLMDPGNTDYGVAIFLDGKRIRKIAFHRYDTKKSYEYANTSNICMIPLLDLSNEGRNIVTNNSEEESMEIDFDSVAMNVYNFQKRFNTMSVSEKMRLANETDRLYNLGLPYWEKKDYSTAFRFFREALRVFPINTDVIGLYGDYYEYSDYDLSMKFYELAISLNSIRQKDYYQLANFYNWKGQYNLALKCYNRWEYIKVLNGLIDQ